MSKQSLIDELQLIRAMTVLATDAVSQAEDGVEPSRLPEARVVLHHVEQRLLEVERSTASPALRAVRTHT